MIDYNFTWKDIPKLLIIILATTAICLLFPKHGAKEYQYKLNNNWSHQNLRADLSYDYTYQREDLSGNIIPVTESISTGDLIIASGALITPQKYAAITKHISLNSGPNFSSLTYFLGYFLLTALILGALVLYSFKYFPEIASSVSGVLFLVFWPVLFSFLIFLVNLNNSLSPYLIPFCLVPIIVFNFYGGRLALFVHIVVVLIASFLSDLGYEFTFLQILAGIITVLIITETRYWNKFFRSILIILITYMIGYLGLALINSGSLIEDEYIVFGWLSINALLLLLAYPFIPLVEKAFGFTSSISLAELADMNNPLIKELSIKAPGTLQHSLQVSNLSEAAAEKIGANSLLVKAAALYHDIGKVKRPEFYTENSKGENHHASLNNFESAEIIIDHVIAGETIAKKAKLPKVIIDFITTHHGTTRVEYFYRNQLAAEPDREFDESLFRYPGPKPKTKEQTILMIADSLEAASKSLKSPTGQDIDQLMEKIIDYKISEGQLSESELSFSELDDCKEVFRKILRSIYHVRVEYPDEVKKA